MVCFTKQLFTYLLFLLCTGKGNCKIHHVTHLLSCFRFLLWRWAPKSHSTTSMHSLDSVSHWSGINVKLDSYDSQMMLGRFALIGKWPIFPS